MTPRHTLAALAVTGLLAAAPATASASVTHTIIGGTHLQVDATLADDIKITCGLDKDVRINLNTDTGLDCNQVTGISTQAGNGGGVIDLSGVTKADFDPAKLTQQIYVGGGNGPDVLKGSQFDEWLVGGAGDDTIQVGPNDAGSQDEISPDRGNDTITGSNQTGDALRLYVGEEGDLYDGAGGGGVYKAVWPTGTETDEFTGVDGVAVVDEVFDAHTTNSVDASAYSRTRLSVWLGGDKDAIVGPKAAPAGAGASVLDGGPGADTVTGGPTKEWLYSGNDADADVLNGGGSNDTLHGGDGTDSFAGGVGTDYIQFDDPGSQFVLTPSKAVRNGVGSSLTGVENALLNGDSKDNHIDASAWTGFASIDGHGGKDTVVGGAGENAIWGGAGDDKLTGGTSEDSLSGDAGNDELSGGGSKDELVGGTDADVLRAKDGLADAQLACGDGADVLHADPQDPAGTGCEAVNPVEPVVVPGEPMVEPPKQEEPKQDEPKQEEPREPADTAAPQVLVRAGKLNRRGVLSVRVTCPAGETRCAGRAGLVSSLKIGRRKVSFGSARFDVAGGAQATVKIKLSKRNVGLVKRLRRISAQLTVEASDVAGNSATAKVRVTLKR